LGHFFRGHQLGVSMSANPGQSKLDQVLAQEREYRAKREGGYREQALKLYPWICGRCTREIPQKT